MHRRPMLFALGMLLIVSSGPAVAQDQRDPLGACLADNTTGRDRNDLATWIFLAMAAHPDIRRMAPADLDAVATESAKTMGALVTRLLAESCVEEAKTAAKEGRSSAFVEAFRRLGEVAMAELMADGAVNASIGQFERFLDQERLRKAMGQH